jgi:hypothetical protein
VGDLFGGMVVYDTTGATIGYALHQNGTPFTQQEIGPTCFVGSQLVMLSTLGITYFDAMKKP